MIFTFIPSALKRQDEKNYPFEPANEKLRFQPLKFLSNSQLLFGYEALGHPIQTTTALGKVHHQFPTAPRTLSHVLETGLMQQGVLVSINFSWDEVRNPLLTKQLLSLLDKAKVPAANLMIEVNENLPPALLPAAVKTLQELRNAGVKIALDDFGTGYASLRFLQELPVDIIKMDARYCHSSVEDLRTYKLVFHTINMAHDLGCLVIMEGIETAEHLYQALMLNADIGQGYYLGHPKPISEFKKDFKGAACH